MIKKVLILGGGARLHHYLKGWVGEVWGVNAQRLPNFGVPYRSRMFDLHHFDYLKSENWPFEPEIEFHREFPDCPLYVWKRWPIKIENQKIFPANKLLRKYGKYHCGSFDWLVCFAIHEGFREIVLNGIGLSLADGGEPLSARACLEYYCGFARGRGIKIVSLHCDLFTWQHIVKSNYLYGLDSPGTLLEDRTT